MKPKPLRLDPDCLAARAPITPAVAWYAFLVATDAPDWVWVVGSALLVLATIGAILDRRGGWTVPLEAFVMKPPTTPTESAFPAPPRDYTIRQIADHFCGMCGHSFLRHQFYVTGDPPRQFCIGRAGDATPCGCRTFVTQTPSDGTGA